MKQSRLAQRRSVAQKLCDAGAVSVNGIAAKSSRDVRLGDMITIRGAHRVITAKVIEIPLRPPSKANAASLFQVVEERQVVTEDEGPDRSLDGPRP